MNKIEINVVQDILKSNMALHEFGRPVYRIIDKKISEMTGPTVFVLNLRDADPLDYEFVNIAFTGIIQKNLTDPNLFLVFKAGKWETEELFTGLTKILKLKKEGTKTDKQTLVENGNNLIIITENNEATYLTNLSEKHMNILSEIQVKTKASSAEIQQKFNLIVEETSQILFDLTKSKFIYTTPGPFYHTVNSLV